MSPAAALFADILKGQTERALSAFGRSNKIRRRSKA
jgi:hypothetical protein